MGTQRVKYTARAFTQDANNAMKGDIVRGLIELITNCDDAYGDAARGKIRIEVEHRRNSPWSVVVRDRAKGMRKARLAQAIGDIGTRSSGFEKGESVRGNLGRGAKDLAAFGPVCFESVCDGFYSTMTLEPDGSFDPPTERKATEEDREQLGIARGNGTVVTVTVAQRFVCPQHRTLLEKLSKHYQLRDINSDPRRDVTLVDLNTGTADGIQYGGPSLTEVLSQEVSIPGYDATASLKISRTAERYENASSDSGRPEGLLIKGRRAIYENSLLSFEANPHAHWFTGELTCDHIDVLAREYDDAEASGTEHDPHNPMPIISRSRDGLEHDHPFYKALAGAVEPLFHELVREEERKAKDGEVRESAKLRRALDSLGKDLGQLVDADLREIDEDGLSGEKGPAGDEIIRIIPEAPVLYLGEDKTLSIVVARSLGADSIVVEVDPEGVVELLEDTPVALTDHPRREDLLIARIHLRPLLEDEETLLTVRCGDAEAVASVEVRPERENPDPAPPEDLEFERARYQAAHGKRRRIVVRAPIDVVNEADSTVVRVTSSDAGVVVIGGACALEFDEDELCFVGRVEVDARVLGAKATLTATLGDAKAQCDVVVAQNDGGGPRLDIKIVDELQGRYRAYVERAGEVTVIKILGGHSAIKRYLGPGPEFPLQDTDEARVVIAEIVAGEAARLVLEKKYRSAGDLDGAAFYAEHLSYLEKYLARCHKLMLPEGASR